MPRKNHFGTINFESEELLLPPEFQAASGTGTGSGGGTGASALAPETITYAGSGLAFMNTYGAGVSTAFRNEIVAAENYLQAHFTTSCTLKCSFDLGSLGAGISGQNNFYGVTVSYATYVNALASHATSTDDRAAVASLQQLVDPTHGNGVFVPLGEARILGLSTATNYTDDAVVLNNYYWTASALQNYANDAIDVVMHELTEGGMGRIGALGIDGAQWGPMDFFRFTASGQRDFTGGKDGIATYFSTDGRSVDTGLMYHNSVNTSGTFDGYDFSDWDGVGTDWNYNDPFGPGGPGAGGSGQLSATDLRIMDVLGWTQAGATTSTPPTVTDTGGASTWTEASGLGGNSPVVIDGGITVSDPDSTTLDHATVSITGNYQSGEDALAFANNGTTMGNIAVSGNTAGVLTLTSAGATATLAQWQAALRAVTYNDNSHNPNTGNRTISFVVNDGTANSAASTKTVSLTAVDTAPTVTDTGGTSAWTEASGLGSNSPVVIDGGITVSDFDNTTLDHATVSITGNYQSGEDVLAFANNGSTMGNIAVTGNSGGVLTLTSAGDTATLAQWQAALRAVTYNDTSHNPNTASRTISFVVNDGLLNSAASTKTVGLTAVDTAPTVTDTGGTSTWTEASGLGGNSPVVIDGGITVSDFDNTTLDHATVSITGNYQSGEDVLAFTNNGSTMGNIAVTGNSAGVLTLTSAGDTATLAQWQAALRAVTYNDSSHNPNTGNRTVSFLVNDGTLNSAASTKTVSITAVNTPPTVTDTVGAAAWMEGRGAGGNSPVVIDGGITVSDFDNATLDHATVSITGNYQSGEDVLAFTNNGSTMGNIAVTGNSGGVLTLTSAGDTATLAQWQAALRALTYNDTSHNPNIASRTISFVVNDGTANSAASTTLVSLTATPTTPNDFNGDGPSDILLRDATSGTLAQFVMHNGTATWANIGWAGTNWQPAGTGDFNGDGTSGILLRDSGGSLGEFVMHNGTPTWAGVGWAATNWQVVGIGDFNGDGTSDILLGDAGGSLGEFVMHNGTPTWAGVGWAATNWQVAGIGDFNGDGTSDILLRDSGGSLGEFVMHNGNPTWAGVGWAATNWQVAGIGDFNGDGTSDILLRDSGGSFGEFVMHNGTPTWAGVGWAATNWQVAGIGDFNGDGTSDILLRDTNTGTFGQFVMHNGTPTWAAIGTAGTNWQAVSA